MLESVGGGGGPGTEDVTPGGTKKTKKLQIEKPSDSGRRLVEYFVVISSVEWQKGKHKKDDEEEGQQQQHNDQWKMEASNDEDDDYYDNDEFAGHHFRPTITARYPLQDHSDNPLHENVTFFCHPSGRIQLRTQEFMPKVHYFVATGGTGRQIYGTCLTLWEPYQLKMNTTRKDKPKEGEKGYSGGSAGADERKVNKRNDKPNSGVGAGEKERQDELDKKEPHDDEEGETRQVYLPKCLVLLSTYPYLVAFREYLTQLVRLSKLGMPLPIERYITNFCSELPAPPPGSFEVQTTILDSTIKIWSPPHNLPIAWVSLPFTVLFECLDIENIILVWHCMALERQILITSTQLSLLTTVSEVLLSLLFPMSWSHAYIPLLPHFLIPILSAPMPFLCGIHKLNLADALYDLSRDCVLVDLDKNVVTLGPDTLALPPLPPYQQSRLHAQLNANAGMIFREARSLTKNDDYSDSGTHLPTHVKQMAENMWESKLCLFDEGFHLAFTPDEARKNHLNGNDASGLDASDGDVRKQSQWDAVQEAFLDTFVYLLRNYRKYLVFPSKHNEGSYGGAGFRSKEYIESQRYDMREFLEQFIGTQMFDNFITKRLYGSGEADVAFFDGAVDRFLKSAGLFADVDLGGRLMEASGFNKAVAEQRRGSGSMKSRLPKRPVMSIRNATSAAMKKDDDPLLQSARVHRKLKTIVPPEPTGEGLPPLLPSMFDDINQHVTVEEDESSYYSSGSRSTRKSNTTTSTTGGGGGGGGGGSSPNRQQRPAIVRLGDEAKNENKRYTYQTFPTEFNRELFGVARPLPAAVIAEFDRQRKDAAQFRRKAPRKPNDAKGHFHRVHATVDPIVPPSPEVSTFTVFFMAFTAMVGKDLIDIAHERKQNEQSNGALMNERTILSTYVPTTDLDTDSTTMGDDSVASPTAADDDEEEETEKIDPEEKARVAKMKTNRPNMGGMFGDEDDDYTATAAAIADVSLESIVDVPVSDDDDDGGASVEAEVLSKGEASANGTANQHALSINDDMSEGKTTKSAKSDGSKPRERFQDKLSDLQIEEAKAHGRAQLGLAFEMITMMKKRGLKADPEAYQCLIDACGRVGDTKRATDLLAKMHEDGIVADGTVYACLVSAFSADTAWKDGAPQEDLPEWANSTAVEMDWNKLQKRSLLDRIVSQVVDLDDEDEEETDENVSAYQKLRNRLTSRRNKDVAKGLSLQKQKSQEDAMEFFVTETVAAQIALGENLLEIVFPDISVDTENEICPRCSYSLTDDHVVSGWTPDSNDYTTACPNCTQRFVPHFCVQCSSPTFMGSRGAASPLMCERLSPWVLQKEIRSVMSAREGCDNLLDPKWRELEYKNAVLWWNLVLSCMRYRFPFSFLLQGSFEQNLIAPLPEDDS